MSMEEEFVKRLIQLRTSRNISARAMSLDIGQHAGYINSIETGRSLPSMDSFLYICQYFGITPQEFFDFDSRNPQELRDLIDDLKKLDIVQLECVRTIVTAFIKASEK